MSYLDKLKNAGPQSGKELLAKFEKTNNNYSRQTYWNVTRNKSGVGSAVIRFLPAVSEDELPMVDLYQHGFKDDETGLWYIENSRTTLGDRDPLSEFNQWCFRKAERDNDEELRKLVSKRKRNFYRITNIHVLKDVDTPANEGKEHRYRFGVRIYDKLKAALEPQFDGIAPIPVFDLWSGSNFNVRVALDSAKIPQYDQSAFDAQPSALFGGDMEALEKMMSRVQPLSSLVAPDQFKSYEQLEEQLTRVIGDPFTAWLDEKATKPATSPKAKAKPVAEVAPDVMKQDTTVVPWESKEIAPKVEPKKAAPEIVIDDETQGLFDDLAEKFADL